MMNKIKFISYTGEYPNLCKGILTVEINGIEIKFGHNFEQYDFKTNSYLDEDKNNPNYERFWKSGGWIETNRKWIMNSIRNEWQLDDHESTYKNYPDCIKKLLPELINVFNENVEYGCCGGCI